MFLHCDALYAQFLPTPAEFGGVARHAFHALWSAMTRFYRTHPAAFVFYELHLHHGYLDDQARLARQKHKVMIVEVVKLWQKQGALKDTPHEVLRAVVIGSFGRMVREAVDGPYALTDGMIAALEEVCWVAIRR